MFYVSVVSDCFINSAAYVSSMTYRLLPPTSLCGPGRVIHPPGSQNTAAGGRWCEGPQRSLIQASRYICKNHSNDPNHHQARGRPVHRRPPAITAPGVPALFFYPSCPDSGLGHVPRFGQQNTSKDEREEALQILAIWGFLSWDTPSQKATLMRLG